MLCDKLIARAQAAASTSMGKNNDTFCPFWNNEITLKRDILKYDFHDY